MPVQMWCTTSPPRHFRGSKQLSYKQRSAIHELSSVKRSKQSPHKRANTKGEFLVMLQSVKGVDNCLAKCIVVEEKRGNMTSCYPPDFRARPCLLKLHD
jgi:hypothetical protein